MGDGKKEMIRLKYNKIYVYENGIMKYIALHVNLKIKVGPGQMAQKLRVCVVALKRTWDSFHYPHGGLNTSVTPPGNRRSSDF